MTSSHTSSSHLISGSLPGPAGALEYLLQLPQAPAARAALVCHPHPLHGGTLHTRIVYHLARTFHQLGMPVLRFNFRGTGKSAGTHDNGRGEVDDLAAALAFLHARFPLPLVLAGFSFGSLMALRYLAREPAPGIERVVAAGLPAAREPMPERLLWRGPKLLISGDQDEFAPAARLAAYFDSLDEPKRLLWFEGADHFLSGRMEELRHRLAESLEFERAAVHP